MKQGFDGLNFLVGLQRHFRDLLVGRDARTVVLMEVSEQLKARYLKQAQVTDPSFLLTGMNVLNQSELNYKQSRNQRLHVELALMKLAHLQEAFELVDAQPEVKKKVITR